MSTERENITLKTVDSYVLLFPLVYLTVFFLFSAVVTNDIIINVFFIRINNYLYFFLLDYNCYSYFFLLNYYHF